MRETTRNIVLIGFASTGKSTTGIAVAEQLGRRFVDLDDVVEAIHVEDKGEKRRCREIFNLFGRDCFINYETRALERLGNIENAVIATGGGTPISEVNRALVKALGAVVYLNAAVAAIFERMATKGYPQYLGPNPSIDKLEALWLQRHPVYLEVADAVIDNTDGTPEEIAARIVAALTDIETSNADNA